MEEAKKKKCCKGLMHKQFFQVSGLCGPQLLSYLPKRFTHLCRALYGDAILVYSFGAPIWPPEINKNIWRLLFQQKLFLFTRELAYMRINISSNPWNGYTTENQAERLFLTRRRSYFGVTHCENSEVQTAVFRNETCYGNGNWYRDLFFVYFQPSVNKNW